jgi:hypothetical protein
LNFWASNGENKDVRGSNAGNKEDFFREKPVYKWLLIAILFLLALGIRIYRINDPPLEFNSSRQYQGALLARYYYYTGDPSASDWQKQMAEAQKPPNYEPPIMEKLTSLFYRISGGESFWFPRLLSVVFWLGAGVGIYLISKKLWSDVAAVFSFGLFLFLPFGIFASRGFLPDPFMVMFMVFTYLALVVYIEKPTVFRLAIAGLLASAAIFVKVHSVFMVLFAFGALMCSRKKGKQILFHSHLWIFLLIALAPGAFYYSYGLFITRSLQAQASWSFMPSLFLTLTFYKGWLQNLVLVTGFVLLFITVLALPLTFSKKTPRALLLGLWLGYFVFSFVFNYHTSTHHYYHLQVIPLVALSVGYVGAVVFSRLNDSRIPWKLRVLVLAILLMAFALDGVKQVVTRRHWLEKNMDFQSVVEAAKEIGEHVGHSMKCVFLDPEYGSTLKYHGWLAGWIWYNSWDIYARRRFRGMAESNARELYENRYAIHQPDFFIVTDFREFDRQDDLKQFLMNTFPVVVSTRQYLIFDTKKNLLPSSPQVR